MEISWFLLPLRFYVKSILIILKDSELVILTMAAANFEFLEILTFSRVKSIFNASKMVRMHGSFWPSEISQKWFHVKSKWQENSQQIKNTLTKKIFRQINYSVISLVNVLLSRNFCQNSVRFFRFYFTTLWDFRIDFTKKNTLFFLSLRLISRKKLIECKLLKFALTLFDKNFVKERSHKCK